MVTLTQFTCSKLYYKPCLKLIENVGQWWRHAYNKDKTMYPTYIIILCSFQYMFIVWVQSNQLF